MILQNLDTISTNPSYLRPHGLNYRLNACYMLIMLRGLCDTRTHSPMYRGEANTFLGHDDYFEINDYSIRVVLGASMWIKVLSCHV